MFHPITIVLQEAATVLDRRHDPRTGSIDVTPRLQGEETDKEESVEVASLIVCLLGGVLGSSRGAEAVPYQAWSKTLSLHQSTALVQLCWSLFHHTGQEIEKRTTEGGTSPGVTSRSGTHFIPSNGLRVMEQQRKKGKYGGGNKQSMIPLRAVMTSEAEGLTQGEEGTDGIMGLLQRWELLRRLAVFLRRATEKLSDRRMVVYGPCMHIYRERERATEKLSDKRMVVYGPCMHREREQRRSCRIRGCW